ncbi:two-component regulator propeller domain-containing protein [Bernardetia sp.]|uniref:ligand-binding sensor domain-containing protein n=1 Tax=Bernardetia sp. TaxID=1937974 RepID=UPI0025BDF178|nr:sensor histidine kinase [Bernardetia sp.]
MKHSFVFLFLLLFCNSVQYSHGQSIGLRHYDVDEGLPQGDIYGITQDEDGFLWIATGNGLSRFDGHDMQPFTQNDGLADNFITAIASDSLRNGTWLGHPQGLLSYHNKQNDSLLIINLPTQNLLSRIQQICVDRKQVWALTEREGVFRISFDDIENNIESPQENTSSFEYQSSYFPLGNSHTERCNVFEKLSNNEFLVGTDSGLFVASVKDEKFIFTQHIPELKGIQVHSITRKKQNQIGFWIGTKNHGIYNFFSANDVTKAFLNREEISNADITSILEDKRGKLWIGTKNDGLFRVESTKKEEKVVNIEHYTQKNGLPSSTISCILQDYEGSIWIGTENDGLIQMLNEMFEIYTYTHGLKSENILSILRLNEKSLLLGTDQGITSFTTQEDSTTFSPYLSSLSQASVRTLYKDSLGKIWIGTEKRGLFIYNPTTNSLSSVRDVPDKTINKITADDDGNIWIATNSWGLFKYVKNEQRFVQILPTKTVQLSRIQNIYKDRENRIWIASSDYTLSYWKDDKLTVLDAIPEFSQVKATCFAEDAENTLWIGSEGSGVFAYSAQAIKKYTTANGLASNYSYFIAADRNYNIWIGSRKGITRLRPKDDLAKIYHKSDGLIGTEANRSAVEKDMNGDLWFGTTRGLIHYIGQNDHINLVRPKVVLSGFRIFGEERNFEENLVLPYEDYSLRFDFKTITFRYPEKVKFKYRLNGFDKNWSETTSQTFAYYSHLEDGEYDFEVLATNDDGIWASTPATYSFSIATPIWKRTWFIVFLVFLGFMLLVSYVRWRTNSLEKQRQKLELEVKKQTKKLTHQNEALENTNSLLKESENELSQSNSIKDRMFSIISHDLRSPLATLQNFLKMFISYRNAFTEEEINKVTRDIDKSLSNVGDLLENLLQWSRAQMGHLETELQPLLITDYVQKNIELLLPTAKNKKINLQVSEIKEELIAEADPNLLNFILRNLISNAIKFTEQQGTVTVSAKLDTKTDKMIHISVKDTGVGMSEETARKIFVKSEHVTTRGTANEKGTGLGLMVCKEFVEKQNGKIWVESKEGEGTTFTFSIRQGKI